MPAHKTATSIVKRLTEAGFVTYFAGGWVRDFLMKRPSDDIDIATSASVQEIQALFPKTIPVGVAFGIVIVVQDEMQFEVATFRKDHGYVDGRRPTGIEPASPEDDAQRRDFTINGMFYDPLKNKLFDFVGGEKDIAQGVIRAIGNPEARFSEDRLRMMRAVRYSTRFNFSIEKETEEAILKHATSLLPAVAMERVWQEFKKMAQFAHFDDGLVMLHKLKLLPVIFPALKSLSVQEIRTRIQVIRHFPKETPPIAELLELFPNSSLDQLLELCDYLKLSRQDREFVRFLHHAKTLLNMPEEWQRGLEKIEWAEFYAAPFFEISLELVAAHYSSDQRKRFLDFHAKEKQSLKPFIQRIQTQNPVVRADDLLSEGVLPGKKMGILLKEAARIATNENLEIKDQVIAKLKKSPLWKD